MNIWDLSSSGYYEKYFYEHSNAFISCIHTNIFAQYVSLRVKILVIDYDSDTEFSQATMNHIEGLYL